MANRAAMIRQSNPGKTVTGRGRRFIEFDIGGGVKRLVTSIDPLHYGANVEIDTTFQPDVGAWQYKLVTNRFNLHARNILNAGDLVEWYDPTSLQTVTLQPLALNWVDNVTNSRQQITQPQAVTAVVDDCSLYWQNGYGTGRHFRYTAHPVRLVKELIIDSRSNLPTPTVSNAYLELEFILKNSTGVTLYVNGAAWNRTTQVTTVNSIEFRTAAGVTVWQFDSPVATDANGDTTNGIIQLRRSGATRYVTVRFPKAWIDTAVYPIALDPTLTDGYGGDVTTALDTHVREASGGTNYGTTTTLIICSNATQRMNALLKFDVSSLAGYTVNSATLSLYNVFNFTSNLAYSVHRIKTANSAWTETGAQWNFKVGSPTNSRWAGDTGGDGGTDAGCSVSGTDFEATAIGTFTYVANTSANTKHDCSLNATQVQSLIDDGDYGLIVYMTTASIFGNYGWASAEHATTGLRPVLVVDYSTSATDDLTAANIDTGAPTLGAPAIGQVHGLTATTITTGTPVLDAAIIGQIHAMVSAGITTASPELGAPVIGQFHILTATNIDAGQPVLDAPTIGQAHALVAVGIDAGSPVLDAPTISQVHVLVSQNIITGAPDVGAPTLGIVTGGVDDLVAAGIDTGQPTLDSPVIGQVHALISTSITAGVPVLDAATLGQIHALISANIVTGAPTLGTPALGQVHVLVSVSITTGTPTLGAPTLGSFLEQGGQVTGGDAVYHTVSVSDTLYGDVSGNDMLYNGIIGAILALYTVYGTDILIEIITGGITNEL